MKGYRANYEISKEDCENVIKKNNKGKFDKINSIQLNKFHFFDKIILDNANIEFLKDSS